MQNEQQALLLSSDHRCAVAAGSPAFVVQVSL